MPEPLTPVAFGDLAGWPQDNHAEALQVLQRSAGKALAAPGWRDPPRFAGRPDDWRTVFEQALTAADARRFFEQSFVPCTVNDSANPAGLFTGYYEPEVDGALAPGGDFTVPLYARPPDLVAFTAEEQAQAGVAYGRRTAKGPRPYDTRRQIEHGSLAGQGLELAWLADRADAFFMQVQGSGRVRLGDGRVLRLTYAGKTGRPYTSIGAVLVARGAVSREDVSMQAIRTWMAQHPKDAQVLMWENESFVFFQPLAAVDTRLGAIGAGKVQLAPQRSLAVDHSIWAYGTPFWLATTRPRAEDQSSTPWARLMVAQDTGTAIRGMSRGDVYWGWGEEAAFTAGHMKSAGTLTALLPVAVARRLGLAG